LFAENGKEKLWVGIQPRFLRFSFITYRSCKHLDNKHSVFGRVVGGIETLGSMEAVGTDNQVSIINRVARFVILKPQKSHFV
jgi:cyclophilin family peptidyl-prolyl cis-trans isomerase